MIGILRRNWREFHGFFVEEAQIQVHKIDPPDAILFFFEADGLIGQGLADKEILVPAEVDAPTGMYDSNQVVMRIDRFGQTLRIAF